MPWRSVLPMEEKIRFIGDYLNGVFNFTEFIVICLDFNTAKVYLPGLGLERFSGCFALLQIIQKDRIWRSL